MRNDPWIFWGFALVVFVGLFLFPPWAVGRLYVIACVFTLGFFRRTRLLATPLGGGN